MRRLRRLTVSTALLLFPALLSPGAGTGSHVSAGELRIEARRFEFDLEANRYTYEDGRLTLGELSLFASRMELDRGRNTIRASGFIRFERGTSMGTAEAMELDGATGRAVFRQASLYDSKSGLYLTGREVIFHPDGRLEVLECTFTTCPAEVAGGWSLSASELTIRPDDFAVAWNPALRIGPAPVFWLPFIAWPTVQERRTGVLFPEISREGSSLRRLDLGWRLKVPVFLALGVDHDLTVVPDWIENRGLALGLEYNYAFWVGQTARLSVFGLKEQKPRDPAGENDLLPAGEASLRDPEPSRFLLDWNHNQSLGDAGRLIFSYRHSSDGQVRREYQGVTEYRPYRTYQASIAHQTGWSGASLTYEQNADFLEESLYADNEGFTDLALRPQLLPRLSLRLGGRPGESFPLGFDLPLTALRFETKEGISGRYYLASPSLLLPVSLGGAFQLRTRLTRHFVSYTELTQFNPGGAELELEDRSFSQSEAEVEFRTSLSRVYSLEGGRYDALKHRLTPRLIFTGAEDVPQPLELADRVWRSRIAQQLVTLRLDNTLLARTAAPAGQGGGAKAAGGEVRELARFHLIQRYNLLLEENAEPLTGPVPSEPQESEPGQPLLPLILVAGLRGSGYGIDVTLNYHHQLDRVTRSAISLNGFLLPRARLGIGYNFNEFTFRTPDNKLVPATNTMTFQGEMALAGEMSLGFDGRVNLQNGEAPLDRRIDRGRIFLDYHPVCYRARLSYEEEVASTLEGGVERFFVDRRIKLTFNLSGLVGGAGADSGGTARSAPEPGSTLAGNDAPNRCNS